MNGFKLDKLNCPQCEVDLSVEDSVVYMHEGEMIFTNANPRLCVLTQPSKPIREGVYCAQCAQNLVDYGKRTETTVEVSSTPEIVETGKLSFDDLYQKLKEIKLDKKELIIPSLNKEEFLFPPLIHRFDDLNKPQVSYRSPIYEKGMTNIPASNAPAVMVDTVDIDGRRIIFDAQQVVSCYHMQNKENEPYAGQPARDHWVVALRNQSYYSIKPENIKPVHDALASLTKFKL